MRNSKKIQKRLYKTTPWQFFVIKIKDGETESCKDFQSCQENGRRKGPTRGAI